MNLPMLIVWIIAFAVTAIVTAVVVSYRADGVAMGMAAVTVAAITFWVTGMVLGYFVTHFSSPTAETWWHALAIRVVWQIGGAVFFALAILTDALLARTSLRKTGAWVFIGVCVAIGTLASLNPLRDLIEGPYVMRGAAEIEVERYSRTRGGSAISADVRLATRGGTGYEWHLVGWPAEKAEEALAACESTRDVTVTTLRRTKRVIDVRCMGEADGIETGW